jgi:hypothetical protein
MVRKYFFSLLTTHSAHKSPIIYSYVLHSVFFMARQPYMGLGLLVSSRFHGHTHLRHTKVGRTPLDEGPARRRDLYLTTHNTHKRQTSTSPGGFFFFFFCACPGFFPDPVLYCLNPFVLHVTLRSMLPSLQQTQHKHPCLRWDSNPQSQ